MSSGWRVCSNPVHIHVDFCGSRGVGALLPIGGSALPSLSLQRQLHRNIWDIRIRLRGPWRSVHRIDDFAWTPLHAHCVPLAQVHGQRIACVKHIGVDAPVLCRCVDNPWSCAIVLGEVNLRGPCVGRRPQQRNGGDALAVVDPHSNLVLTKELRVRSEFDASSHDLIVVTGATILGNGRGVLVALKDQFATGHYYVAGCPT